MLEAEKELAVRGSIRAPASRELQAKIRLMASAHMQAAKLNYKTLSESCGIDHSQLCKFMNGKVGLSLGLLAQLERIVTDNHGESVSDLPGLADAIACRLLHGDGRISNSILTRYENEVRQCNN